MPLNLLEKRMSNTGGQQVSFARAITDKAAFGYLADLFAPPASPDSLMEIYNPAIYQRT